MAFLNDVFEKDDCEKVYNVADNKTYEKLPSMQRVSGYMYASIRNRITRAILFVGLSQQVHDVKPTSMRRHDFASTLI